MCVYKMCQISKEAYKKCETEIINKGKYFWINRRDLEIESDYDNWVQIFDKCDPEKQKYGCELMPNSKFQPCRRVVRSDLVGRKVKSCRKASQKLLKFKETLGLDPFKFFCDEKDIINALQVAFEVEIILTQYYVENKRLDAYFPKYKAEIEVVKHNHKSRYPNYEKSKQLMIGGHGITVIRTNPEAPNAINRPINQIQTHIIKSPKTLTEKSAKKSLIDDISKRLLELEFKSNHSIKSKCLKWIVRKVLPTL